MNTLVELTQKELDSQAFNLASGNTFIGMVDSDIYVDDMSIDNFNIFISMVKNNGYTIAQYKYIIDKAITLATM